MRCVELFAGAGGASLGLRAAGFTSVLQAEKDPDACATLRAAGFTDVLEGDVRDLSFQGVGPVDLLWSSPPCQSFSNLGLKAGFSDDRNGWPLTWDAVDRMRAAGGGPTWLVCENVLGVALHDTNCEPPSEACRGCYWDRVVAEFETRFAHVSWRVVNAADHGVPQRRERVFLAAGPTAFAWPTPTHSKAALAHAKWAGGSYWRRHDIPPEPSGPTPEEAVLVGVTAAVPRELPWVTVRDATGLTQAGRGETATAVARTVDDVSPTVTTRGTLYTNPCPGEVCSSATRVRKMRAEASAIRLEEADDILSQLEALSAERLGPPEDRRRLTVEELAALQAFPPGHPFSGTGVARYRQVGNAVPPLVAAALGRAVAEVL